MFGSILSILRFGQPYLKRYWGRLVAGVLLGVVFGLSNASFVWATKTLIKRLAPTHTAAPASITNAPSAGMDLPSAGSPNTNLPPAIVQSAPDKPASESFKGKLMERGERLQNWMEAKVDRWMPLMGREPDWRQILGGFLLLPILVSIRGFIGYLSSYCMSWVSERMMSDLRYDVLAKLYSLSLDFFNRSKMGDLLTRINTDTAVLQRTMTFGLSDIIKEPFTIVAVIITLCLVNFKLTMIALVFLPACVIPLVVLGRKMRKAVKASRSAAISQSSLLVEAITSIRVVKAFGLESDSLKRFGEFLKQIVHHDMKSVQAKELVNPLVETISVLGLGLLIVAIFYTRTELDDLVGFLTGIILIFTPIKKLASVHVLFQQASVGIERLQQLFAEQPSVKELADGKKLQGFQKEIRFENVTFAYHDRTVIHDLDLVIPRGTKLGVVGVTGSGKSTLVNLMFRFYDPAKGCIRIDGQDLRDLSVLSLREHMALVSQDIVIFDQSVAENIACGRKGATREEVIAAAKAAYAHEFIEKLEHGYDTKVGERGVTLSGGQRQRLCIARAFVRNAPILVLDEATANLDSETEGEVQAAIDRLEENRTVICIAHRLSTLATMNRIIVLKDGRMIEDGTFEMLLTGNTVFADLARRQGIFPGSSLTGK